MAFEHMYTNKQGNTTKVEINHIMYIIIIIIQKQTRISTGLSNDHTRTDETISHQVLHTTYTIMLYTVPCIQNSSHKS